MTTICFPAQFVKPREATIDKMNISVTITGDNLHGNGNNAYFPLTRLPLTAICRDGNEIKVKIGPHCVHEDIQRMQKEKEKKLPKNGLGHLKIFSNEDYEPDDSIQFCSDDIGMGLIDIGRYGPLKKTGK